MNGSLDFLNMIKNSSAGAGSRIAVIDTETNWHDRVMSIGLALADADSFKCVDKRYYVIEPECRIGGIYSDVLFYGGANGITCSRKTAISDIKSFLAGNGVSRIFAYNARFDCAHLPELGSFNWYDIMRLAAYRQYNGSIPDSAECCKTGRLKSNYGVEPIMRMLTGNNLYREIHNAVFDAVDELRIVELLGHPIDVYECAKI